MCKQLKDQGMRRCKHSSSYFRGAFNKYGRYQWDIKFYDWQNEYEVESAVLWAFGEHVKFGTKPSNGNSRYHFDQLSEVVGRPVEARIQGRSGGWLVIDSELTEEELAKVDAHVEACMKGLKAFLTEERAFRKEENNE